MRTCPELVSKAGSWDVGGHGAGVTIKIFWFELRIARSILFKDSAGYQIH